MTDPTRYDGVCPKNAVCTHCGYHIGGVAITDGSITCPECGESVPFAFAPVDRHPRRFVLLSIITPTTIGLILGTTLWSTGTSPARSISIGVVVLLVLLPISIARTRRRIG